MQVTLHFSLAVSHIFSNTIFLSNMIIPSSPIIFNYIVQVFYTRRIALNPAFWYDRSDLTKEKQRVYFMPEKLLSELL